MSQYDQYYSAINEIKSFLSRDLIGPTEEKEVIESIEPLSFYAMGILWAKRLDSNFGNTYDQVNLFTNNDEDIEVAVHSDNDLISDANTYKPSAMGVSVMLPKGVNELFVEFSFGRYTKSTKEVQTGDEKYPTRIDSYSRTPFSGETIFAIPKKRGNVKCIEHQQFRKYGVEITLCLRKIMPDGSKLLTVSMANIICVPQKSKEQNEGALFQCKLKMNCAEGFIPIYQNLLFGVNDDELISAMQYREVLNYAYGHGCSVFYAESEKISTVESDFLPTERILQMMPGETSEKRILSLAYWKNIGREEACDQLDNFISEYISWSRMQNDLAQSLDSYKSAANIVLERINICIARLKHGINILRTDNTAWSSFKYMNEAMLIQRIKSKRLKEREFASVSWYPFQLAYILQIIPDVVDDKNKYRELVDLLWYPTGGGKTEAYLGVAAFIVFYRRLFSKPANDGVTIIMRYTLRLLTIQQFERASALICACEHLRKIHSISGDEINIGLWIGSGMTPNRINGESGAAKILSEMKENPDKKVYESNPVQITSCPWCGETIDLDGYEIISDSGLRISCNRNSKCEFHNALPIYVVDDDIYRIKPTLLLSTIDKFARLAWEENSKSLFGNESIAPPSLIIQDELHLISGPLGSLAGIYEIGIDYLCSKNGRYPKVIASTATVRNASEQIKNLYNKQMFQFPPSGINFTDSFFAVCASEEQRPARTFLGLCEPGGSLVDLMIRVYANLFYVKLLFIKQAKPESVIDQFSTIIGYFNSIKDLGSADNIINDRIYTYLRTLVNYKFKDISEEYGLESKDIRLGIHDELTSRKTSKEVKETLSNLSLSYSEYGYYSYILASNMLSVGIDIDRLGVMVMYGQPKTNAEYIQATSRVGRRNPGIVLALYNGARSRDKSHYEQFGFYHKSFYQYVEATSVTPFTARAIEKAIHCIFIIMLRLSVPMLNGNNDAVNFQADGSYVIDVKNFLIDRVKTVNPKTVGDVEQWLNDIALCWDDLARDNPDTLVYYKTNQDGYCNLLIAGEQESEVDFPATLNSLRNVEPSSNVFIQARD